MRKINNKIRDERIKKNFVNKERLEQMDRMISEIENLSVIHCLSNNLKLSITKVFEYVFPIVEIKINNRKFISLGYHSDGIVQVMRDYTKRMPNLISRDYYEDENEVYEVLNEEFLKREKRNKKVVK